MSRVDPRPDRARLDWAALAPTLLLLLVAALQIFLSQAPAALTPAKGGGWGMFASVDRLNNRHFVATAVGKGWETAVRVSARAELRAPMREMLALPSERHMARFAGLLVAELRQAKQAFDADGRNAGRAGYGKPWVGVRVRVYKRAFDAERSQARAVQVGECLVVQGEAECR